MAVHCSVVSYSIETCVVSSLSSFLGSWIVNAEPYGSLLLACVNSNTLDPKKAFLIVRKEVSKMTWSMGSSATSE